MERLTDSRNPDSTIPGAALAAGEVMAKMRWVTVMAAVAFCFGAAAPVAAQDETPKPAQSKPTQAKPAQAKPAPSKPAAKPTQDKPAQAKPAQAKPVQAKPAPAKPAQAGPAPAGAAGGAAPALLGQFGEWKAYASQGAKSPVCYVFAQPKDRKPPSLKRDPGFLFISSRPAERVRNEVSAMVGFPTKEGGEATVQVGNVVFDMATKDDNAWIRNPAEESRLVEAMRKSKDLVLKVTSLRGNESTDHYSLNGLGRALDRIAQECK